MVNPGILHLVKLLYTPSTTTRGRVRPYISVIHVLRSHYTTRNDPKKDPNNNNSSKWFTLPPFTPSVNGAELGKAISCSGAKTKADATTTALKWVLRCCPELPRSLVQKLFRLRQVPLVPFSLDKFWDFESREWFSTKWRCGSISGSKRIQ